MSNHILVVDDCEDVRFLLSLKLKNLGHKVSESNNIESALELIQNRALNNIEVIIFDISLKDISSKYLLNTISSLKQRYKHKIICICSFLDDEIISRFKEAGADEVLKKPINACELSAYFDTKR